MSYRSHTVTHTISRGTRSFTPDPRIPWNLLGTPAQLKKADSLSVRARVSRQVLSGIVLKPGGFFRAPQIFPDGTTWCQCEFFRTQKKLCSHLIAVLMAASEKFDVSPYLQSIVLGEKMSEETNAYKSVNDLSAFNTLVDGMPIGALVGLFGMPASNKSYLAYQLAWTFFDVDKSVLVVDTEGGAGKFALPGWVRRYNARFKTSIPLIYVKYNPETDELTFSSPPPKNGPAFYVVDLRHILRVLKFHGFRCRLDISKPQIKRDRKTGEVLSEEGGGKMLLRFNEGDTIELEVSKTPIGKFVAEHNIGYIVYDSVTNPFEIFISGQLNFPGRDEGEGLWFQQMQSLASDYNTTIVGVFHLSQNPASIYDKYGHPIGGKAVNHNFKFMILIRRFRGASGTPFSTKPEKVNKRALFLMRHPEKEPFAMQVTLQFGSDGFTNAGEQMTDDE